MKIKVTEEHIKNGKPCKGKLCPIALAIREQVQHDDIWVYSSAVRIDGYMYNLPERAKQFIEQFDDYKIEIPIEFEIERIWRSV